MATERGRLRIVLIEDNVDVRDAMVVLLAGAGHDVRAFATGYAAIGEILRDPPDVALVDIGLPDVDGHGVARAVRARLGDASLVMIAVTAYGETEDRRRALASGFDDHLVKPVAFEALVAAIDAAITRRRTR